MYAASPPDAIIDRARQRMAANVAGLPNFTCTETTARTVRRASTQRLLFRDTLHLEVAFISGTEMFSWPGSGSFEPGFLQNLPHSGVSGTGGFAGWTRTLFGPAAPQFTSDGDCIVDGRQGAQYKFRVPIEASGYEVQSAGGRAVSPYSGTVCIDPVASDVMRLSIRAESLQNRFAASANPSVTDTAP
ncbi:MAG TPA: hypothetical protein VFA04_09065 [Bryobacteraceae bacterium]|nr:hypothetical protein [Bryobacteraceae bacterium]